MVTRHYEQPTWLPKMGIFIASINKCGDSGPWRWDNCTELDDKLRSCKFHVQQVYSSSTIKFLSQSGDRNHHMISQCLESGVLFANPNINGPWTRHAHELVACTTDTSTIQARFTRAGTYLATHDELKFSTSTLEWPMSWKLWCMSSRGPGFPCEGYDVSRQEARRGYTSAQALHPNS